MGDRSATWDRSSARPRRAPRRWRKSGTCQMVRLGLEDRSTRALPPQSAMSNDSRTTAGKRRRSAHLVGAPPQFSRHPTIGLVDASPSVLAEVAAMEGNSEAPTRRRFGRK